MIGQCRYPIFQVTVGNIISEIATKYQTRVGDMTDLDLLIQRSISHSKNVLHTYHQASNIRNTFGGKTVFDHSGVASRRCSKYTFILDLTPGFSGLGRGNCKTRRQSFKFWDLVQSIFAVVWWQFAHLNEHNDTVRSSMVDSCVLIGVGLFLMQRQGQWTTFVNNNIARNTLFKIWSFQYILKML